MVEEVNGLLERGLRFIIIESGPSAAIPGTWEVRGLVRFGLQKRWVSAGAANPAAAMAAFFEEVVREAETAGL